MEWATIGRHVLNNHLLVIVELLGSTSDHVAAIDRHLKVIVVGVVSIEERVALDVKESG